MRGRSSSLFIGLLAAASLAFAGPLAGQQGTLTGRVTDKESGRPLNGAQVQVLGAGGASAGGVLTDNSGQYRVSLPAGTYSVVSVMVGYETARVNGVSVPAGGNGTANIVMTSRALALNPVVVTVGRGRQEKALDAPAALSVVPEAKIQEQAAVTPVEYVKALPGVDVVQTGLTQSNTVTRGFNNVFSGALLVMEDYRYAFVPSLRFNAYNMIPAPPLDIQRVEVVLGPAAALYGPNAAEGVLHIITTSPLDDPGTKISLSGGERDVFQGAFREGVKVNDKVGFKLSGLYFRGHDWVYHDSTEVATRLASVSGGQPTQSCITSIEARGIDATTASQSCLRIGDRNFEASRFGGEARLDLRPWDDGEVIFSYGLNQLVNSIELTGIGAGQAKDWRYQYGQVRVKKGRLFAQAFLNKSNAGSTYLLRTGEPIVDHSTLSAAQVQYGFNAAGRVDVISGVDWQHTNPVTDGTINGANENNDQIDQVGGYVHTTTALSSKVDFVAALRIDHHNRLQNLIYSPRAALVFKPARDQNFRLTFNRAFSTPTSNNLFLDIVAARIPITSTYGYDARTLGVPETGFTFNDQCAGGVDNLCMYSPFAPGQQLPASGLALWNGLVPLALAQPALQAAIQQLGMTPAQFAAIISDPQPGDLQSQLLRFNQEAGTFIPDAGPTAVERIRPTIYNTFEAGYKGVIADKLSLSASVYRNAIKDFVGPLRVETPSVFLTAASMQQFLVTRLTGAGIPAAVAGQLAAGIAVNLAQVPLGTVAPDQRSNSDLVLTYRNFGNVNLWGADVGFQYLATDRFSFNGSFSWVSKKCFDFNKDGSCTSAVDISLNAPKYKGSLGVRYDDKVSGLEADARVRYSDAFVMNSGVYIGPVPTYNVVDANVAYELPWAPGATLSLTVTNLFNDMHNEFVGAPMIGRLALVKLQYDF
jgi:outer membrane receptor for ferrienterochelin and colicins